MSGVWSNGGGGWTDKFDSTAATYNNAKPVVAQFTNAAAGTNVTVATDGVTVGNVQVSGSGYSFTGGTITMTNTTWSVATNQTANVASTLAGMTGVTKSGNGTLALGASNSYTGTTTVNGGKLIVDGSLASGSTTVVGSGGLLGGSGKVGALNLQRGATLTPGNSPGLLTASSAVWGAGATYEWQLGNLTGVAGTDWDLFRVTGTLDMSALNSANKFNLTLVSDGSFDLSSGYEWTFAQAANFTGLSNSSAGTDITNLFQIATQGMGVGANPANVKVLVGRTTSDGFDQSERLGGAGAINWRLTPAGSGRGSLAAQAESPAPEQLKREDNFTVGF